MQLRQPLIARSATLAAVGALAIAATAPTAGATTLKLKNGTTKLAFGKATVQKLTGMGIDFAPIAPASATGATLSFPIRSGTLKVTGSTRKNVTGRIAQRGGMSLSNGSLSIGLTKPVINLAGKKSTLDAVVVVPSTPALPITIAKVDVSKAKTSVTSKRVRITGMRVKLTALAAQAMNTGFGVTGFMPGFPIGTATLNAGVKR